MAKRSRWTPTWLTATALGVLVVALTGPAQPQDAKKAEAPQRKNFEIPAELTSELRVKAAYNDTHAFVRFQWASETANVPLLALRLPGRPAAPASAGTDDIDRADTPAPAVPR